MIDIVALRSLAEEALADDARSTPGPWERDDSVTCTAPGDPDWGSFKVRSTAGHSVAYVPYRTDEANPHMRHNGPFIVNARLRESALARAVIALLEENAKLRARCDPGEPDA